MPSSLTAPQRRGLEILGAQTRGISPRDFALKMWPDSPAWSKRTRGQRGTNRSGAMGGTMPMIGAKLLYTLDYLGLAREVENVLSARVWIITNRGREALRD